MKIDIAEWDSYYKMRQKSATVRQKFIGRSVTLYKLLLVLQSSAKFITKCVRYYKVRQLVFTIFVVVTKCIRYAKCDKPYYKVRQELQSVTVITK